MKHILLLLFLLSGASALVYEIAWVRILGLVLGNTAQATSCVLAVFMGGLAIGALAGGKYGDRDRASLKLYGAAEMAIALSSLLATAAIQSAPHWLTRLEGALSFDSGSGALYTAIKLATCSALMLPPTIFMGATLPILMAAVRERGLAAEFFSKLYGANLIGAVLGSLLTCFVGFAYFGIWYTVIAAAALNITVALLSFALSAVWQKVGAPTPAGGAALESPADLAGPESLAEGGGERSHLAFLCLLAALCGYASLSYEVLYTRLLRFYLTSLTYTFTVMLTTFLVGMALGSFIYRRRIYRPDMSFEQLCLRFAKVEYLGAIACAGTLLGIPVVLVLKSRWILPIEYPLIDPSGSIIFSFAAAALTLLIPATILGVLFPLVGTMAARDRKTVGGSVGAVYAANTIGCVLGSLTSGLFLMPTIGSYTAFQSTVLISIIGGAVAALQVKSMSAKARLALALLPVAAGISFLCFVQAPFYRFLVWTPENRLLKYGEDTTGTIFIIQSPEGKSIVINGSSLASTIMPSLRYMRMLGHLPAVLHAAPRDVLVGCFGTGTTAGAIALHPDVEHVQIVELSPTVIASGYLFSESNYGVLHNPKVTTTINDVRNFLLGTRRNFDVITFEPPPPCEAGMVNLYTQEFYQLVKQRLKGGGIVCQWVPLHQQSATLWKMMIKSARLVFPHVSIWLASSSEALMICSSDNLSFDLKAIETKINAAPQVKRSLTDVGFDSAGQIVSTLSLLGSSLDAFIEGAQPITDDRPSLEFFMPYAGPLLTDLQVEQTGTAEVERFIKSNRSIDAAARKQIADCREALHLTRLPAKSEREARANIDKAARLYGDNPWFAYLRAHIAI